MFHLTPTLRALIAQHRATLPAETSRDFELDVDRELSRIQAHLLTFAAGVARGREVQRLIDAEVGTLRDSQFSCRRGCGACCHLEVQITNDDAAVLRESLREGTPIDLAKLRVLSERTKNDPKWRDGICPENRCVFLGDDNACRNYQSRPAVCRKHLVASHPIECETLGGHPVPVLIPMAEIVLSAALSVEGTRFGALSTMLQESLDSQ